ncbi:MAG: DUF4105 domain-containing protein, partial [Proteobacteria bacterium]|nr:DUF4105 domain-containing protein [Pseudomonadota bacterium]
MDDESFFLARGGKTSPVAELEATLDAFFAARPSENEMHPQCRFIARFEWLKQRLDFDEHLLTRQTCPGFRRWINGIDPDTLTLVFPNYYLASPASIFGHSLLRINSRKRRNPALLSYAVNYAATVDAHSNPVSYLFNGVFGGFPGTFSIVPYYITVRNYNDIELRDIWEYELGFTREEVIRMLKHLWELSGVYMDYYFFKENCSYHLLSLLEAARPSLSFQEQFLFWTIPADTIKIIDGTPGLVKKRNYRPSRWSKVKQRFKLLNDREKEIVYAILQTEELIFPAGWKDLPKENKSRILDIFIEYYDFLGTKKAKELKDKVLLKRALLKTVLPVYDFESESTPPEQGHKSSMTAVSVGAVSPSNRYAELGLRISYHDLLDDDTGYQPYTDIEFFSVKARIYEDNDQVLLDDFTIVKVTSLVPQNKFLSQFSWKLDLGIRPAKHLDYRADLLFDVNGGIGLGY